MSLDIYLKKRQWTAVAQRNITNNVGEMAAELGCYEALWHPEESGIAHAYELITPITVALKKMAYPEVRAKLDRMAEENKGWGTTDHLKKFLCDLLHDCVENQRAKVEVSR